MTDPSSGFNAARARFSYRKSVAPTSHLSTVQKNQLERAGWQRAQKRTYHKWLSYTLRKNPAVGPVNDVEQDLKDGIKLCALMEIVSGKKLPNKVWDPVVLPKDKFKALENASTFIRAFQAMFPAIKLTLGPQDIVDGNFVLVMGLLWRFICVVQFDVNTLDSDDPSETLPPAPRKASGSTPSSSSMATTISSSSSTTTSTNLVVSSTESTSTCPSSSSGTPAPGAASSGVRPRIRTVALAQANLLEWVNSRIAGYGLTVDDFCDSIADGKAFQALVASIDPTHRYELMVSTDSRHNLEQAFARLDKLGIPPLLSADDMVGACSPDTRSVMTYLSMIHMQFKDHPIVQPAAGKSRGDSSKNTDGGDDEGQADEDEDEPVSLHVALRGRGLKTAVAGVHNVFVVTVMNTASGLVIPSGDELFVELLNTQRSEYVLVYEQSSDPDGSSVFSYIPSENDAELTLNLWHSDSLITTLTITVSPPPPDPSVKRSSLVVLPIPPTIHIGEPVSFSISGLPPGLDPALLSEQLSVVVDGPHSQVLASLSLEFPASASFVASEPGEHTLYVYYHGVVQHRQLVNATLSPASLAATAPASSTDDPDESRYGAFVTIGTEAKFDVTIKDASPDTHFRVICPDGKIIIPAVEFRSLEEFTITYVPTAHGEYTLETISGPQRLKMPPVFARPQLVTPDACLPRITINVPHKVLLHAHCQDGRWAEGASRSRVLNPCGDEVPHAVQEDVLVFTPTLAGRHRVELTNPKTNVFQPIQELLAVLPDPVFVQVPSSRVVVGTEAYFSVSIRNVDGSLVTFSAGQLEIMVDGPSGRVPTIVTLQEEGYHCEYIPDCAGDFQISIILEGRHIRGCTVTAVDADVGQRVHQAEKCTFEFEVRDPAGNVCRPEDIQIFIDAPSDQIPQSTLQILDNGMCSISFLPCETGLYQLSCKVKDTTTPMPSVLVLPKHVALPDDEPAPGKKIKTRQIRKSNRMSTTFNARASRQVGTSALGPSSPEPGRRPFVAPEVGIAAPFQETEFTIKPLPSVQTAQSFRVWMGQEPLEKLLGLEDSFKTFTLSRTLCTEELRQNMVSLISKGRPPELVSQIHKIVREQAYCICEVPLYGGESSCRRLLRKEVIATVIHGMRQSEDQVKAVSSTTKHRSSGKVNKRLQKRLERGSGLITQENARFLATQAHRLYVRVHDITSLPTPQSSEPVHCSVMMNAQKYRTEAVPIVEGPLKFKSNFTFGTNTLQNMILCVRLSQAQHILGAVQIPLEQLLVSPSWEAVFPLVSSRSHSGNVRLSLEYSPNESVTQTKLSRKQIDAFCRSQPCRLMVSVLQVESLPTGSSELSDMYYRAAFNRQFQKSSLRRASNCPNWSNERLPIGVAHSLPDEPLRILFQAKQRKSRALADLEVSLEGLPPNHELTGWFPLRDIFTGQLLPVGRALVSIQYVIEGAWSTETLGRLFFRPAPPFYLTISVLYPKQRVKVGELLRVQVKVRDLQSDSAPTDNLSGGELELHVVTPSGATQFLPIHKNYPNPQEGLFYIDFIPSEPGTYVSMLKYNDQEMQHRNCNLKVKPSRGQAKIVISIDQ